jgi:two-component system sensor histidine kinase AtoS
MLLKVLDSIENRMMIPFLLLVVLSIISVGFVSIWSAVQYYQEMAVQVAQERIERELSTWRLMEEMVSRGILKRSEAQQAVLDSLDPEELFYIFDGRGELIFASNSTEALELDGIDLLAVEGQGVLPLPKDNWHTVNYSIYRRFPPWDWHLGTVVSTNWLTGIFLEIQKYTLLIAVIAIILAVQATIILSHNFSRPLKKMASVCNALGFDNLQSFSKQSKYFVQTKRNDEIGTLSRSFASMLQRIMESNKKLVRLKSFLESILQSSNLGNLTWQASTKQIMINKKAASMFELTPGQIDDVLQEIGPEHEMLRYILELCRLSYRQGRIIQEERAFMDNGRKVILELNVSPLQDENGKTGATCSFQDITERKKIEERMERLDYLAYLGEMAAGIAHEIRNPLAGMKTSAEVIKRNYNLDADGQQLLENIVSEIDRINSLIIEMLKFSGDSEADRKAVNLNDIIKDTLTLLRKQIRDRQLVISMDLAEKLPAAYVDEYDMKQVILNIVINAIQEARSSITINTWFNEESVFVSVGDDGPGIPEENRKKIFSPFFTTKKEGTGMGLAVVLKLVNLNEGEIDLESSEEDTVFTLMFARAEQVAG